MHDGMFPKNSWSQTVTRESYTTMEQISWPPGQAVTPGLRWMHVPFSRVPLIHQALFAERPSPSLWPMQESTGKSSKNLGLPSSGSRIPSAREPTSPLAQESSKRVGRPHQRVPRSRVHMTLPLGIWPGTQLGQDRDFPFLSPLSLSCGSPDNLRCCIFTSRISWLQRTARGRTPTLRPAQQNSPWIRQLP